ncbi:unnamed protein product [Urochloa decumbens]|uniref:Uncharacterized protein n=1 Tax=Urochloa decumbens TaxID=240449 RepID=A0ABC8WR15_9POAL
MDEKEKLLRFEANGLAIQLKCGECFSQKHGGKQTTVLVLLLLLQDVWVSSWPCINRLVSTNFDTTWAMALLCSVFKASLRCRLGDKAVGANRLLPLCA